MKKEPMIEEIMEKEEMKNRLKKSDPLESELFYYWPAIARLHPAKRANSLYFLHGFWLLSGWYAAKLICLADHGSVRPLTLVRRQMYCFTEVRLELV